ncbi:hypothetical protein LTR92_000591 [Exophiala xenobiotica]|nr:hypothetical protein LTR92_000591 [Exophiala xenobiotica]KAK5422332.1 hypothetical protein LTR06_000589 [Exophiala xenobiotica]
MPAAGAGVGFGLFMSGLVVALILAETPDSSGAPKFWQKNMLLKKVYYLAFYSGKQLRRDLNLIIGLGKNCKLSFFWSPLLQYITGPVLAIVFSFADPGFQTVKNDPMYIPGFIVAQFLLLCIVLGFVVPKWLVVFIPRDKRNDEKLLYAPDMTRGSTEAESDQAMESGESVRSGEKVEEPGAKQCEVVRRLTMTRGPEIEIEVQGRDNSLGRSAFRWKVETEYAKGTSSCASNSKPRQNSCDVDLEGG